MTGAQKIRPQHHGKTNRTCADHKHRAGACHLCHVDGVQADCQWFDQSAFAKRNVVRQAMAAARADAHIFGVSAGALAQADADAFAADAARVEIGARQMFTAANIRKARKPVAGLPQMFDGVAHLDHFAGKFMAHHRTCRQRHNRLGFGHVQIGAADAAVLHLEDQIDWTRHRIGDRHDGKRPGHFLKYGCAHFISVPSF